MTLKFKGLGHAIPEDIGYMQPALIVVLSAVLQFCRNTMLNCRITNIRHRFPNSVSNTHPEGRAFDVSVRGWSKENIKECVKYVEKRIGYLGAISSRDNQRRIAVVHDIGYGRHIHFQVARDVYLAPFGHLR